MNNSIQYFRNPAADSTYCPAGYLRTDWHSMAAEPAELRAIYEHVLRPMQRYEVSALLFVHGQPEAIPEPMQRWLASSWIPRAVQQAACQRCAIVEVARTIGQHVAGPLAYAFFSNAEVAARWLLRGPALVA